MHPSLEPVADELHRPSRIMLTELAAHGYIALELLELADADLDAVANPDYRRHVARRWKPTSPLARAARAAGAYLEARGADLAHVRVMGEAVLPPDSAISLEARENWLRSSIPQTSLPDMTECVFVLPPNVKRPLRALLITAVDQAGLRDIADLDLWLSQHAPHICHLTNPTLDQDPVAGWRIAGSTPPPISGDSLRTHPMPRD
jgi:hypothetical protein